MENSILLAFLPFAHVVMTFVIFMAISYFHIAPLANIVLSAVISK